MNKKILVVAVSLMLTLILISSILAITASIGNGKMILRAQTGDILEKYIRVINDNNVSVNILLTASGDLQDSITIKDKSFTLQPNEEKNAEFAIKVTKSGTTESKINVQFTPVGEKNGAGLSSTITVIASGEDIAEENISDQENPEADVNAEENSDTSSVKYRINIDKRLIAVLSTTLIMFIAFIVLLIVYYTQVKKKNRITLRINTTETTSKPAQKTKKEKIKPKKRAKKRG